VGRKNRLKSSLLSWPGKSATSATVVEHPAVYHMLDVAAVAEQFLAPADVSPAQKQALVLLTALHDLGKISADFRAMLRGERNASFKHWEVSDQLLVTNIDLLATHLGVDDESLFPLLSATAGHHGRPPNLSHNDKKRALNAVGPDARADARAVIMEFVRLWPEARLNDVTEDDAQALSWWLPGLVAVADWVGSNTLWFEACGPDLELQEYLTAARAKAANAVRAVGLGGVVPSAATLFDFALRPMQAACAAIPLPDGPMLAVIEDETGAGKTEAALILAQRMMLVGKGRGLFFALPTMATADAMFSRATKALGKLFTTKPSLTLAHGRAGLSVAFQDLLEGNPNAPEDIGCTEWLAESRRRALLADIGVGTVDQALLSVLPVKWQTLRHFGLSSKILIVDEVHELGEPYIDVALTQLLRMHRKAGGSAILLTATLPMAQRRRLMAVYDAAAAEDPAYPALTLSNGAARRDLPQATGARGAVQVQRLASTDAAVEVLVQAAGQGAACVWVRNAVDDAIAAVGLLQVRGVNARLLHARFALGDRKRIEAQLMGCLGKDGQGRAGQVFVCTQVFESSLDADVDVMVSDLAPMAALVQRAGRLWRHMDLRPQAGRPVPEPVLYVVSPDPADVPHGRWLNRVLESGAHVYGSHLQWRTADHLFRVGQIVAPSGLRGLIEAVHGEGAAEVPAALEWAEIEGDGKAHAAAALGWQSVVALEDGYAMGGQALDDTEYPTRLGQPQKVLVLARRGAMGLEPLFDGAEGWALSEVTASAARLSGLHLPDQSSPEIAAAAAHWPAWKRKQTTVCILGEGGEICEGLRYGADEGLVFMTSR
jgi:CRISPR-associated endonuclease/helicase Cas3